MLDKLGIFSPASILTQQKLSNLRQLIEKQIKYADQLVKTSNSDSFDHIKTIADFHQLHIISNKIRSQLDHLLDIENKQINNGHIRLDKQSAKVRFLTKMGLLFLTILLILHYIFMMNDVTKRKKAESELLKLNEELEDRIERRTKALQESREQHRLMIESVRDYALFMLDTDGFITNWNRGAEHTYGYTSIADQQNIKINSTDCINQNLFVKADQQKLKHILLNLLNNAIKYNRDKGSVKISCLPLNGKSADESRKMANDKVEMVHISDSIPQSV